MPGAGRKETGHDAMTPTCGDPLLRLPGYGERVSKRGEMTPEDPV